MRRYALYRVPVLVHNPLLRSLWVIRLGCIFNHDVCIQTLSGILKPENPCVRKRTVALWVFYTERRVRTYNLWRRAEGSCRWWKARCVWPRAGKPRRGWTSGRPRRLRESPRPNRKRSPGDAPCPDTHQHTEEDVMEGNTRQNNRTERMMSCGRATASPWTRVLRYIEVH